MTGTVIELEGRGKRTRRTAATRAAAPPASTLKEAVMSLPLKKRGRELATAFINWLRSEGMTGTYSVLDLHEAYCYFADAANLLDFAGEGNDMRCFCAGELWEKGTEPPHWLDISRKLGTIPNVQRRVLTESEARRRGVRRGQVTIIGPLHTQAAA